MQQRHLGSLAVSAIGLGCMGLSQGYGPASDDDSITMIRRALDLGVTHLDTAMSYGAGHNERLVSRAIVGRREQATLATKFGIVRDQNGIRVDARPEHVRRYCDDSLKRLDVDVIDLYYVHRPDPDIPIAETVGAVAELVEAGKVRHIGVSEFTVRDLRQAAAVHPIAAVQFEWSLMWREAEDDVVPAARDLGIGLVPYSPLGRGLLTATLTMTTADHAEFRRNDPRFHGADLQRNLALVAELRALASEFGISTSVLALAWLLAQGPDVGPIPGTRRLDRMADNATAADVQLGAADLQRLADVAPRGAWAGDRYSFAVPTTTRTAVRS
ncbi:aldo/keto reductase [Nocardia gipuzkoensis]